jgi:hypothetical protein
MHQFCDIPGVEVYVFHRSIPFETETLDDNCTSTTTTSSSTSTTTTPTSSWEFRARGRLSICQATPLDVSTSARASQPSISKLPFIRLVEDGTFKARLWHSIVPKSAMMKLHDHKIVKHAVHYHAFDWSFDKHARMVQFLIRFSDEDAFILFHEAYGRCYGGTIPSVPMATIIGKLDSTHNLSGGVVSIVYVNVPLCHTHTHTHTCLSRQSRLTGI